MIMILLFYVLSPFAQGTADWRSGPQWSIISVLCPVHPFATTWHFPSRGNERYEGKNSESYTSGTIPVCPPLVAGATTFPPAGGLYSSLCCERLMKGMLRGILFCPLNRGKSGAARIGGASAASQSAECYWRSGPRWSILSVLCPVHPFATTWHFPSRGNKKFEEKNRESYTSCTTPEFPLWWLAPPPCPVGSMSLDSRVAGLPYESSSFATPAVRWGGKRKAP